MDSVFSVEKLKPQRAATFGEVTAKHGFDVETLEDCQPHWASKGTMRLNGAQSDFFEDFNWKRTKVAKSQGMVTFPSTNVKGIRLSGGLYFESQFRKEIDWGILRARSTYWYNKVDDFKEFVGFDQTTPERLFKSPFWIGTAHTGYHVFPGTYETVIEAHSTRHITSINNLERSEFSPMRPGGGPRWAPKQKYRSGLIALPPAAKEVVVEEVEPEKKRRWRLWGRD